MVNIVDAIRWLDEEKRFKLSMLNLEDKQIESDRKRIQKGREPFATQEERMISKAGYSEEIRIIEFLIDYFKERVKIQEN